MVHGPTQAVVGLGADNTLTEAVDDVTLDIETADIDDDAVTAAKIADAAIDDSAKVVAGVLRATDMKVFVSAELTGDGTPQSTAHALGAAPTKVVVAVTEVPDAAAETGFDVAEGAHDATNVIVTVTNTVKYKVFAWV